MSMSNSTTNIEEATRNLSLQPISISKHGLTNHACEQADEAATTDSEEYLSEPLRYRNFQYSTSSNQSTMTLMPDESTDFNSTVDNFYSFTSDGAQFNIEIPIVGYEIMEERARFTVYKLRVENKSSGDCWYVFRRYTDFVRLCNRLRTSHPDIVKYLPRKRWLKNNFDPLFLEERVIGLQTLVNAILNHSDLTINKEIQDFFCLTEPPIDSETNEESRAQFEAFEETINELKVQLQDRENLIENMHEKLNSALLENENLLKMIRNSTMNCQKCQKDYENLSKVIK